MKSSRKKKTILVLPTLKREEKTLYSTVKGGILEQLWGPNWFTELQKTAQQKELDFKAFVRSTQSVDERRRVSLTIKEHIAKYEDQLDAVEWNRILQACFDYNLPKLGQSVWNLCSKKPWTTTEKILLYQVW